MGIELDRVVSIKSPHRKQTNWKQRLVAPAALLFSALSLALSSHAFAGGVAEVALPTENLIHRIAHDASEMEDERVSVLANFFILELRNRDRRDLIDELVRRVYEQR